MVQYRKVNERANSTKGETRMEKMIYSNSLGEMVNAGFTKGKYHYTWNDSDCLYYNDEIEDIYYIEIPLNCILD